MSTCWLAWLLNPTSPLVPISIKKDVAGKRQFCRPWCHTMRAMAFDSRKSRVQKGHVGKGGLATHHFAHLHEGLVALLALRAPGVTHRGHHGLRKTT